MDLKDLETRAKKDINGASNLKDLEELFRKYLGRAGELTRILRSIGTLPEEERRIVGKEANMLRRMLQEVFKKRAEELQRKREKEAARREWIDVTAPGKKMRKGHLHPLTLVSRRAEEIFQQMGFTVVLGPEVEDEWHNFDALNIPKEHPARDLWDTFWLRSTQENSKPKIQNPKLKKRLLLRTHTSSVQIRYMENNNPPFRIVAPGRVFRHEATDASHEINFYQLEGLMVDKAVSIANFKAVIREFFQRFFRKEIWIRLRPSYFPFVEPGFEVDITCFACKGRGCSACMHAGWVEIMGAGMVHPKVFSAVMINPRFWKGFAFGMGLDRLAMMKYKINDIRLFYEGDLRFLQQF